jgi:hypothetical protein
MGFRTQLLNSLWPRLTNPSTETGNTCLGGIRHKGGVNLSQALVWNVGTCRPDGKGETQVEDP